MATILAVLMALEPMEWLTIGLVVFAAVQVWLPLKAEQTRLAERERDEKRLEADRDRATDAAYQLAWAEQFRIDQLSNRWGNADLIHLSALGVLDPSDVLPRDWSLLMGSLSHVSIEAGHLGGVALTIGHDIATHVAVLNGMVQEVRQLFPGISPSDVASRARGDRPRIVQEEIFIKELTKELATLLADAIRSSPRAGIARTLNFPDDLDSAYGRAAVAALAKRAQDSQDPLPSSDSRALPRSSKPGAG